MPVTYLYPQARELREIGPTLVAKETANDILFKIMPLENTNAPLIEWTVEDDPLGLQNLRGLDGADQHVTPTGDSSYVAEPGYYGDFMTITERELTLRAGSATGDVVVDLSDLVAKKYKQLVQREMNRIRQIIATLITTGTFSVTGKNGSLSHTDTFALQTYSASDWSVKSTATPLADLQGVQALGSEFGTDFGGSAIAIGNRKTINYLLQNTNAADLGGRRTIGGGTINSVAAVNAIALGEDLPSLVIDDDGYKNDAGTFVRFFPDDVIVVVGLRLDGDNIGKYKMTRNMNNPGGTPGSHEYIKDYVQGINAPKETPPRISVHRGHNGGPTITRPKSIVVMAV